MVRPSMTSTLREQVEGQSCGQTEGRCSMRGGWFMAARMMREGAGNEKAARGRPSEGGVVPAGAGNGASADDLVAREELGDLDLGVVLAVGAVDRVLADGLGIELADGAFGGALRVGGAHDLAVAEHGVLAFQNLHDDRSRDHEVHELAEKGTLLVDRVEGLGLAAAHENALLGDDPQAGLLDDGIDGAGEVTLGRVGLDDGKSTLDGHDSSLLLMREMVKWGAYSGEPLMPQG